MSWNEYWKEILSLVEQDNICIQQIDEDRMDLIKSKFKSLWKKGIDCFDAYEQLVEMF